MGAKETVTRTRRQLVGRVLAAIGGTGSAVSLIVVSVGLRAVLGTGGFCAGGGAYAMAHRCDRADTVLLLSGMLGMLTCGGLLAAAVAWMRGPVLGVGLSLWVALFAALGWNFIDLGAFPPHAAGAGAGRIVVGAALWLVTLIGLVGLPGALHPKWRLRITVMLCPRISMWQGHTFDPASLPDGPRTSPFPAQRCRETH